MKVGDVYVKELGSGLKIVGVVTELVCEDYVRGFEMVIDYDAEPAPQILRVELRSVQKPRDVTVLEKPAAVAVEGK
jgi:hypothetical protein